MITINQSSSKIERSMSSDEEKTKTWGSWEELLLACAVKRHGFKNWESISMELQTKTSLPHLLTTAQCCKQKYQDLKRRFKDEAVADNNNNNNNNNNSNNHHIPWLEQLRKVRVDELKREVQRYDISILSLQHKVKKLEEEREKPDLEKEKTCLLNDKTDEPERSSEGAVKEVIKGLMIPGEEESDRENRSVNESNSTGLSAKNGGELLVKREPDPVRSGGGEGPVFSGSKVAEEDSVTQLSSDVQSSASFGTKRRRGSGGGDKIINGSGDAKSEPLIWLLDFIRTHNHVSSLFERRLKSQESNKYKEVVRQHVDLETIQARVEGGSYSSCILTFYRDLLLLFNNAIVYFPKSSLESEAALHLRNLVSNEIKKDSSQEQPPPPPPLPKPSDSLLAKQKASAPIIVCRKRSSVSAKPSLTFAAKGDNQKQQSDDTKKPASEVKPLPLEGSLLKVKTEEKPIVTGARSSRRSSRNLTSNTPIPPAPCSGNMKQNAAAQGSKGGDKQETPNTDNKKKTETSDKKKSVVDFLKRIKKNSPVQTVKKSKGGEEQKKSNNSSGKNDKGKERILLRSADKKKRKDESSPSKRSVGRPPKKTPEASTVSGKRGKVSGGKEGAAAKRQSKRARR